MWVDCYNPETKQQFSDWKGTSSAHLKRETCRVKYQEHVCEKMAVVTHLLYLVDVECVIS
jgi:hypothetical protein